MLDTVTKHDLRDLRADLAADLNEVKDLIGELRDYQRTLNGKVADMSVIVARHDERINNNKDNIARWIAVGGTVLMAVLTWVLRWTPKT